MDRIDDVAAVPHMAADQNFPSKIVKCKDRGQRLIPPPLDVGPDAIVAYAKRLKRAISAQPISPRLNLRRRGVGQVELRFEVQEPNRERRVRRWSGRRRQFEGVKPGIGYDREIGGPAGL